MKLFKIAIAAAFAFAATSAYAFHSGGVAECEGCHLMHTPAPGGSFLLQGVDQSSTCLICHGKEGQSSYHIATPDSVTAVAGTPPYNLTPGGDFGWLKKSYSAVQRGNTVNEEGEKHGHNIIAAGYGNGFFADSRNATAPGGTFPNSKLFCNACHDPHGKYRRVTGDTVSTTGAAIKTSGSYANAVATLNEPDGTYAVGVYRLLAGSGYAPVSLGAIAYPGVPPAKVPSNYNRSEDGGDTRVAYGVVNAAGNTQWGRWCGTCHPAMHSGLGNYVHPVDQQLGSAIAANYNSYVVSGNMNGNSGTSFSSLAPFATNASASYATLNTAALGTQGPGQADQVNCLSCHRVHASGFISMLRFDPDSGPFITQNGAYVNYLNKTTAETQKAYYDRSPSKFSGYQRVWCNKCHAKD